jgi:hypothetical protein
MQWIRELGALGLLGLYGWLGTRIAYRVLDVLSRRPRVNGSQHGSEPWGS